MAENPVQVLLTTTGVDTQGLQVQECHDEASEVVSAADGATPRTEVPRQRRSALVHADGVQAGMVPATSEPDSDLSPSALVIAIVMLCLQLHTSLVITCSLHVFTVVQTDMACT